MSVPAIYDAILVDIDHSPRSLLNPRNTAFYDPAGMKRLTNHISPSGVVALWSADSPDDAFMASLGSAFQTARAEVIEFFNPVMDLRLTGKRGGHYVVSCGKQRA